MSNEPTDRLAGAVVLVTGGASGLGRAVAEGVREAGGRPLVLDRVAVPGMDSVVVELADARTAEEAVWAITAQGNATRPVVTPREGTCRAASTLGIKAVSNATAYCASKLAWSGSHRRWLPSCAAKSASRC